MYSQHIEALMVPTGRSAHCCAVPSISHLVVPAMQADLLESNIYAIAELAQSVFKRENSRILGVIHDMLYPQ